MLLKKKPSQNNYGNQFSIPFTSFYALKYSNEYRILQKKKKIIL